MMQLSFLQEAIWTVSEITRYLRDLLASDDRLKDVWVRGEISNFSRPSSGHLYFTLKDSTCSLRSVMWRSAAARLTSSLRDGEAVEAHGYIDIYETAGQYQFYVDIIRPFGEGALFQQFLRLKAQLEAEGLFSPERKRLIPSFPQIIGIVTSPTGAALKDVFNTLRRRYPLAHVVLAPSQVQGEEAPNNIVAALDALNRSIHPDVILLVRGGGSIEDLWAFNDERVARAVAASEAPVISGVGHETDFTIVDFVSDLRAPTPTACAELATPSRVDLQTNLEELSTSLDRAILTVLDHLQTALDRLDNQLARRSPVVRIGKDRQHLDELIYRLSLNLEHFLELKKSHLKGEEQHLAALNPLSVLNRGYAMVVSASGEVIRTITQVKADDSLTIQISDGNIPVIVSPKN